MISRKEIERQFERIRAAGWFPYFQEAARRMDTSTAHVLGFGSRETNLKNIRGDFRGGQYHGFGVLQVDIGTDPEYCRNWRPDNVEGGIVRGADIYNGKVEQVVNGAGRRLKIRSRVFTGKSAEADDVRRIATAGYNCGLWAFYHFTRSENIDSTTTGHDYSRDVYDRAIEFADLLESSGIEAGALKREVALQGKYARKSARERAGVEAVERLSAPMGESQEDQSELARTEYERDNEAAAVERVELPAKQTTEKKSDDELKVELGPPARLELKPENASLTSRLAALGIPTTIGGFMALLKGLSLAGVSRMPVQGWYVLAAMFVIALIIGAWLYNESQNRRHDQNKENQRTLADPNKQNVVVTAQGE